MHRKVPAWFGGGERGKGPSTWEDTSPRSLSCHLSYVRDKTGHALIGARQWIPREHIEDPVKSLVMGLPPDLGFRTKGQLAIDICADCVRRRAVASTSPAGTRSTAAARSCGSSSRSSGQAYVLRVASNFTLTLAPGTKVTCAEAVKRLLKDKRRLGGPLRRPGLQGRALVRLGLDRHRLSAPSPAGPPPPEDRRAGLSLLLRARRAAADARPG